MEGNLCKVSEEASEKSWDILWNCLHWDPVVTFISDDVVRRLLHRLS